MSTTHSGGFDCHVHVVDPARHPFPRGARIPDPAGFATLEELDATLERAGLDGALIVQPSPYMEDNAALLDALARGNGRHRGIAGLSLDADDETLRAMDAAGVVGVRLNIVNFDLDARLGAALPAFLPRVRALDWWVELQCRAVNFPAIAPVLEESGVKVVFDHVGLPDVSQGPDEPGFRAMCAFAARTPAAIKLSGAFRASGQPFPHQEVDPFAAAALEAFGVERCVWGSDYPFLWLAELPRYADTLATLERWVPDAADRDVILRQSPRRLFGFGAEGRTPAR